MEEEQDYVLLLLDSWWCRDCSSLMQTPLDISICPILYENDETESLDFKLEAASAAAQDMDSVAGDWILENHLLQGNSLFNEADFDIWSDWSEWSEYVEDIAIAECWGPIKTSGGGSWTRDNPQRIPGVLNEYQSFQGSHCDPRYELQNGFEGVYTRRKNICGFLVYVHLTQWEHCASSNSQEQAQEAASRKLQDCPSRKTGRSSKSYPALIGKLKLRYDLKLEAKSATAQAVGDEVLLDKVSGCSTSMSKSVASFDAQCSTLKEPISDQKYTEVESEIPMSKTTMPRVLNNGKEARKDALVPNWSDEKLSALLLSKIKALEGDCGDDTTDQGLWGRTPLGKKLESDIAAKGNTSRRFNCSKNPKALHNGLTDSELLEQTGTEIDDDGSQNFESSFSLEDEVSSGTALTSATNEPEAEGTGDNFLTHSNHSHRQFGTLSWLRSPLTKQTQISSAEKSSLPHLRRMTSRPHSPSTSSGI